MYLVLPSSKIFFDIFLTTCVERKLYYIDKYFD